LSKPFDFVESITYGKNDLLADGSDEKDYVPFLTNKALSYFADTVLYANEMNVNHHLPRALQYAYLLGSVRPKRRRSPWHKADAEEAKLIELISHKFSLSHAKARQALPLLSQEQIDDIKASTEKGGY
jgi:hypothetical protein